MAIKKNIDVHSNIKAMQINIPKIGEPVLHTYRYDQLNRIKAVNNYNNYNTGSNAWTSTNAHKELLLFDANGNIQTALLNGNALNLPYENLTFTYDGVKKNRLLSIHNSVDNVTGEYESDAIGNVTKDELEGNENMQWNVYGKLKSLEKIGSGTAISFGYDAAGNRISKKVGTTKQQWYVRDASGNIMASYIKDSNINGGDLSTEMFNMYGSSMLGAWKLSTNMEVPPLTDYGELERGNQEFYFSNQLGNNLVILSDRKEGIQDTENPTQVAGYRPHVLSATDYNAYGENLIGREYNATGIKFGFNGKWNDFETGYQDYGMRMYSSKKRGFNGIDPYYQSFPWNSPYSFAEGSPIKFIDYNGGFKIAPSIEKSHPLIYTYLSQNLEKEVLKNVRIINAYKEMNPRLTDRNIQEMFSNNSGAEIVFSTSPGGNGFMGEGRAAGYYEKGTRTIEINTKIFDYVEGVLKNEKSTDEDKTIALSMLKSDILHEGGHDAARMTGQFYVSGAKKGQPQINTAVAEWGLGNNDEGEPGGFIEKRLFGLPILYNSGENKEPKNSLIKGIGYDNNTKNTKEYWQNILKKEKDQPKDQTLLPTVPVAKDKKDKKEEAN